MIRLALRVSRADADVVLAELMGLAPNGVEQVDDGDVVEYAVYGAPGELPQLGEPISPQTDEGLFQVSLIGPASPPGSAERAR